MHRRRALSFVWGGTYLLLSACGSPRGGRDSPSAGSAFARVLAANRIRAGYVSYPPGTIVDPSSGEVSGIFPDLLRAIGQASGLEVQFTEEVGYADIIEGLRTGRFDIVGGVWANPNRAKGATISEPAYFSGLGVWVRFAETRFTSAGNWASLNDPRVRIGAIDGSSPLGIITAQFPNASLTTYPNLTTEPQLFLDLTQGRIDVFLAEPAQGILFSRSNPRRVRNIAENNPIRVFENVFLMPPNELQFKTFIDASISDLRSSGRLQQLIDKYEPVDGAFHSVARPYE